MRGSLDDPVVTLWSDPPMTQTEALAYLLLGRPLGSGERTDPDYMRAAPLSLEAESA